MAYKPKMERQSAEQICAELGCVPIKELAKMVMAKRPGNPDYQWVMEPRLRVEALKSLAEHIHPKLRTQEVQVQADVKFTIVIDRYEEIKKLPEPRPAIDIGVVE